MTTPVLDRYEMAFLAGGTRRVVDAALVALVQTGRVRVDATGCFVTVDRSRRGPVEAAVLDAVGTRGHRSIDTVRWRVADDSRVLGIAARLHRAGLLVRVPHLHTRAGSRALRAWTKDPPPDPEGTDAVLVAVRGAAVLNPGELRAALVRPPRTTGSRLRHSRSSDRLTARAEELAELRQSRAVLHGRPNTNEWIAPGGA